jgi:hypothetical protein
MKAFLAGFLLCATALCQDGPALLHKTGPHLVAAGKADLQGRSAP